MGNEKKPQIGSGMAKVAIGSGVLKAAEQATKSIGKSLLTDFVKLQARGTPEIHALSLIRGMESPVAGIVAQIQPSPLPALAEAQVEIAKDTHTAISQLVELTEANIGLARQSIEASEKSDRFSRRIAWVSVGISVLSLLIAGVSLFK
jgi:hypothetical protein